MRYIGCAGWTIPREFSAEFPEGGTHLERYAKVFPCCEINSSFYRPHRATTWERWAESTPVTFRFAVKAPKIITHERSLACTEDDLLPFFDQIRLLGDKLGPILFQLPPKHSFDPARTVTFLALLRRMYSGPVVIEPRHVSWFADDANRVLVDYQIARAGADPAPTPDGSLPGGSPLFAYRRLHGSPRRYYSAYSRETILSLAKAVRREARLKDTWVIFDNTASGAAAGDALGLLREARASARTRV